MDFSILNLFLVLLSAWLAGRLADRLGYPSVLGELFAGILLGPPLLGLLQDGPALQVLAELGILLMMLYIGMEIDPRSLVRAAKGGILAAVGGFITPFVLCYAVVVAAGGTPMAGIFVGLAAGVTSLATKSRILVDLRLLDTRVAHVMMAGALVADTVSLILFAAVLGVAEIGRVDAGSLLWVAGQAVLFFAVAGFVGLKLLPPLLQRLLDRLAPSHTALFTLVVLVALAFAEGAELAGMHGILGAFVAGLCLRETALGRSRARELMHTVRDASLGLLAPIFFVTAGFAVSLSVFATDLPLVLALVLLATVGKIVGTALLYLFTGHGWREGLVIGAGMNGRGAVEIIVAQIGLTAGLITADIFSMLVFMAIATTATVPLFLKWGVSWLRTRGELVRAETGRAGTVVVGAGPTARALAAVLARDAAVTLVDRNAAHCDAAEAEGLTVVRGDAADEAVLALAGAAGVQRLVACTPNPEVNALVVRLARDVFQVPEVLVGPGSDAEAAATLQHHLGAQLLFGPTQPLADWDYWLAHDQAERSAVDVVRGGPAAAVLPPDRPDRRLLLAVRRGDTHRPYHAGLTLEPGDRVIQLHAHPERDVAFDAVDKLLHRAPVLDLERGHSLDAFFDAAAALLAPSVGAEPAALARRLHAREHVTSTVLMPGLAVPHVQVEGTNRFGLLLARCRDGVHFPGHPDPVTTLVVLAGSEDHRTTHLRALSAVAQVALRPGFEQDWLTAPDAEALRDLFVYADRRRFPAEKLSPQPLADDA